LLLQTKLLHYQEVFFHYLFHLSLKTPTASNPKLRLLIPEDEAEKIEEDRFRCSDPLISRRLHALYLKSRGYSHQDISELQEAKDGKADVYFVDAAHFVLGAFLAILWSFQRIFIKTSRGRKRLNILGALNGSRPYNCVNSD
jgi:hypothetical protein